MFYLDNAATTRPYPEIQKIAGQALSEAFGNPSSTHPVGVIAGRMVQQARKQIAKIFKVPERGVLFTGSGTESDNLAIIGTAERYDGDKGFNLVSTKLEHDAVLKALDYLENKGFEIRFADTRRDTGQVDLEDLKTKIDAKTLLVSIHQVNSETGALQDLSAIGKVVKTANPKTIFHVDGVQGFTKVPLNLKKDGVDLYSVSAHKIHALKGTGALIMTRNLELIPRIYGGGQEFGARSGTENVLGIAAFGAAAEISMKNLKQNREKVAEFSGWLKTRLTESIPGSRFLDVSPSVPHILSYSIPKIPGSVLLNHLGQKGIQVSQGSACHASSKDLSPTLLAFGVMEQQIIETIRISLDAMEIPDDREAFLKNFTEVVEEVRSIV